MTENGATRVCSAPIFGFPFSPFYGPLSGSKRGTKIGDRESSTWRFRTFGAFVLVLFFLPFLEIYFFFFFFFFVSDVGLLLLLVLSSSRSITAMSVGLDIMVDNEANRNPTNNGRIEM